jgi:hypothetical protein
MAVEELNAPLPLAAAEPRWQDRLAIAGLRRLARILIPAAVGGIALYAYIQTLLPSIGWGDIARFQYLARIWGIPHRFGYPLYIAISRLFGYLPVGDLAYRINLMSAVFAALAVVMVYFIVMRLSGDWVAAVSASLAFAFSRAHWGQAVFAEVYALNAFLIGAVLLSFLSWHQTRKLWLLYFSIGLYALSFGNHMTVVTLVPAVIYLIVATDYRLLLDPKKVAIMVGLVLLGASQYLYVILRSQQQPLLNELGPFSWGGWIHWMTRNRFPGQFFGFGLGDQVDRLRIFLELLEKQFYRWGYILGFIGAWERLRRDFRSFAFLALAALGLYVFCMNYGGITFRTYLIPLYLIFAVFIGCAIGALRERVAELLQPWPRSLAWVAGAGLAAVFLVMPLYPARQNWALVDQSHNTYYRDEAWNFVNHVEPEFVLVESETHYDDLEAILYTAWAEKQWYQADTAVPGEIDGWLGRRPVYAWLSDQELVSRYVVEPVPELPEFGRLVGTRTP